MTEQFRQIRDLRERFMRAVYDLRDPYSGIVGADKIGERIGIDPLKDDSDEATYHEIAHYFGQLGYIKKVVDGYGVVSITPLGIRYVEGDLQRQEAAGNVTFNVENAYGSIFGTQQHAEMNNVSFDFRTVEAELDRAEEVIERRGGRDTETLRDLITEVRALRESDEPLDRERLAKYLGVIQRNGWIAGPIAGALLSMVTGA